MGSIAPNDSSRRIDIEAMRQLLEMGPYFYRRERDLDLFCENEGDDRQKIILLDNELKTYHTSVDDVALRKSPTTKEMISIRNAIKILNDKAVVVSRKGETLQQVKSRLIDALDLSFTPADIDALVQDGNDTLKNNYAEGVVEILTIFAELLGYQKAPKTFQLAHHQIWGISHKKGPGEWVFGPAVIFSMIRNTLSLHEKPVSTKDKAALKHFQQIGKGKAQGDINGESVFGYLKSAVIDQGPAR